MHGHAYRCAYGCGHMHGCQVQRQRTPGAEPCGARDFEPRERDRAQESNKPGHGHSPGACGKARTQHQTKMRVGMHTRAQLVGVGAGE